jgi:4'-phosphopantetheinyl transferase
MTSIAAFPSQHRGGRHLRVASLGPNDVHTWLLDLSPAEPIIAAFAPTLSAEETAQAGRFVHERHRMRYIMAHGAVRLILGAYLDCSPNELIFQRNPFGKPSLAEATRGLAFNLSHSDDKALVAVTSGFSVGVDIERVREDLDVAGIARQAFAPKEFEEWSHAPAAFRTENFFQRWTLKEAYIKGIGLGLSRPTRSFSVSPVAGRSEVSLQDYDVPASAGVWSLHQVAAPGDYLAALAAECRRPILSHHTLTLG